MSELLPDAAEVPPESANSRRARRYLTGAILIVAAYAVVAATVSGAVIAFQYFGNMRTLLPLARVLSWPAFDVADVISGMVRLMVALATRDEALAALVATIPAGLVVFGHPGGRAGRFQAVSTRVQKAVAVALITLAALWIVVQPFLVVGAGVDLPVSAQLPVSILLGASGMVMWMRAGDRTDSGRGDPHG